MLNTELELAKKEKNKDLGNIENDLQKELGDNYESVINQIQIEDDDKDTKIIQKKIKSTNVINSNVIQADVSQDIKNKYKNR